MKTAGKIVRFGTLGRRDTAKNDTAAAAAPTQPSSASAVPAATLTRGGVSFNSSPDLGSLSRGTPTPATIASSTSMTASTQASNPGDGPKRTPPVRPARSGSVGSNPEASNTIEAERPAAGGQLLPGLSSGYLNKLAAGDTGARHMRWRRRWFAFSNNLKMVYWPTEEEARANPEKPTGEIDLSLCSTKEERLQDKRFVFCIVTARHNLYLEAASHEEMLGWMSSIDEVKMKMVEQGDFAKRPRVSSMIRKEKRRGELTMLVEASNEDEEDRWDKRYFILKQNNFLCYYANKEATALAGPPIDLLICTIQEVPGETWCFEVMEGKRVYWLMAQSELEMCSWISSLRNAITMAQAGVFHERLAMKPQFKQDHVAKAGWLKKQKIKGWGSNRRWFVLQGEYLLYYRSPQQASTTSASGSQIKQRDAISTLFTKARQLTDSKSNCFELLTALRTYRFEAESDAEARAWVQAIENLNQTLISTQLRNPLEGRRTMQLKLMDIEKALS